MGYLVGRWSTTTTELDCGIIVETNGTDSHKLPILHGNSTTILTRLI